MSEPTLVESEPDDPNYPMPGGADHDPSDEFGFDGVQDDGVR